MLHTRQDVRLVAPFERGAQRPGRAGLPRQLCGEGGEAYDLGRCLAALKAFSEVMQVEVVELLEVSQQLVGVPRQQRGERG